MEFYYVKWLLCPDLESVMMNGTTEGDIDIALIREQWNDELARTLLPDTICLAVYFLIGLLGNSTVLYVYTRKIYSEARFFIPVLAVLDLIGVIVNCSFSMSINILPVMFDSDIACKVMWFLAMLTTGVSAFTLLVIAVQRYRKICKPFKKQMTYQLKRVSIVVVIIIMLFLATPGLAFYGSSPVEKSGMNVTGYRCTSVTAGVPTVALVYKAILFLTILIELIALVVLYTLIGRLLFRQTKFMGQKKHVAVTEASGTSVTYESATVETDYEDHKYTPVDHGTTNKQITFTQEQPNKDKMKSEAQVPVRKRRIPGFRISLMFMVITAVYVVCFIPKLTLMVWESRKPDFWQTLTQSEIGIFRFLYTLFIINNIANPFIYGFLDKKFQTELKVICCRKNNRSMDFWKKWNQ